MGLDACIEFEFHGDDEALSSISLDFERRQDSDNRFVWTTEYSEDTGTYGPNPPFARLDSMWRVWDEHYERGPWCHIRPALDVLLRWQSVGRIGRVWYFGDSVDRQDVREFTRADLEKLDEHHALGFWTYWGRDPAWSVDLTEKREP